MPRLFTIRPSCARPELWDDGGVTDESTARSSPRPADEATPQRGSAARARLRLLLSVAGVVLALTSSPRCSRCSLLTPGQPVSIIGDTVTWTLVRNSGAAFSMATGYTWVLTLVATGVVFGIVWMGRRLVSPWWALGLGMILGGAMGNLVDRFFRSPGPLRGHVVDFLSIGWWPVFNVADPRWWAGRSCWSGCRCSASTSTPSGGASRTAARTTVGRRQRWRRIRETDDHTVDAGPGRAGGHAGRRRPGPAAGAVAHSGGHAGRGRAASSSTAPPSASPTA